MAAKKAGKTAEKVEIPVPTFTIRADSSFGIQCMMAVKRVAADMRLPHEEQKGIAVRLREFDLYEELTRE